MKEEKPKTSTPASINSVNKILKGFKNNIKSLLYYFNTFEVVTQDADKSEADENGTRFREAFSSLGLIVPANKDDKDGLKAFKNSMNELVEKSPQKMTSILKGLVNKSKVPTKNFEIFSRSSFIMLSNYFEYLLSDLLAYYYNKYQGNLKEKKFNLTLKEINEYETIAEAVQAFITQEVESLMASLTFEDLLKHFEKELKISNEKLLIDWRLITEYRERRHLIVHNASVVNKKYLLRTGNPFRLKVGDVVHITKDYFLNACNEYYLAGLLLSYNSWGQWDGKETTGCIKNILNESFALLEAKEYGISHKITKYAIDNIEGRTSTQEDYLARINFNRLICIKKTEKKSVLDKELKDIRVGTMSPVFKLAYAILAEQHSEIMSLIKQVKMLGEIKAENYEAWPIFEFIHEVHDLDKAIREEFDLPLVKPGASDDAPDLGPIEEPVV
ncbi:hypothetical protein GCM10027422_42250 [Hymenobacter arcticus]